MTSHVHDHETNDLLAALLDVDAQVHASLLDEALTTVSGHVDGHVRRVLDVGAGTGSGSFRLANLYPSAEVIALDLDARMSARVQALARTEGMQDRIIARTGDARAMDLDPGSVDLVWSSSVLHELDDPAAVLTSLHTALRPGGVLAILEMDAPPRVLAGEHAAIESRLRAAAAADAPAPEWTETIRDAGFVLVERATLASDQTLPGDGPGGEYAVVELRRLARYAAHRLTPEDDAALRGLLGHGSDRLPSVRIRGTRSLWIARRP